MLLLEVSLALLIYIILFVDFLIPRIIASLSVTVTRKIHVEDFPKIFIADMDGIWYDPVEKTLYMTDKFTRENYELLMQRIGDNVEQQKVVKELFKSKSRDTGKFIGLFEAILLLTVAIFTEKLDIVGWYLAAKFIALNARDKENQQYYILGTILNVSMIVLFFLLFKSIWEWIF